MKYFSLFIVLFSFAFASCSKSDDEPTEPQIQTTTFTLSVDEPTLQAAATRTQTNVDPKRYIMEVWSKDGQTAENVFGTGNEATNHAEILATSGSEFTVTLDKTKEYTCLFWADFDEDNTSGSFNAGLLKTVSLNTNKEMTEAYHAKVDVEKGRNPTVAVTLKRAVTKITLTEIVGVKIDYNLALKISNVYTKFDVMDAQASGTAAEWGKTIKLTADIGQIATLYFFAKTEKELCELKFTYAEEVEKIVANIPVQQNHATNIKGEYSNILTATFDIKGDDEWTEPENVVDFPEKAEL